MRYPSVILFRYNKYSHIDTFIESNKQDFMCSIYVTSDIEELTKLFNPNYHLLVTYGDSYDEYHNEIAHRLPQRFSGRWFHKSQCQLLLYNQRY